MEEKVFSDQCFFFLTESVTCGTAELCVVLVSDVSGVFELWPFTPTPIALLLSTAPLLPRLALESRTAPALLLCVLLQDASIEAKKRVTNKKNNFFMEEYSCISNNYIPIEFWWNYFAFSTRKPTSLTSCRGLSRMFCSISNS
jgi:hypothetical protein